jgi:hypothetical protein
LRQHPLKRLNVLAGKKRAFASFLVGYANRDYGYGGLVAYEAEKELAEINRTLRELIKIIEELDPKWAVENQERVRKMSRLATGKGLALIQAGQRVPLVFSDNPEIARDVAKLFFEEADKLEQLANMLTESIKTE